MATTDVGSTMGLQYGPTGEKSENTRVVHHHRFARNFLLASDFAFITTSALAAWFLRFGIQSAEGGLWHSGNRASFGRHFAFLMLYAALFLLFGYVRKLYIRPWTKPRGREITDLLKSSGSAALLVTSAIYISGEKTISREVIGATVVLSSAILLSWRMLLRHYGLSGITEQRNVVIVGAGRVGRALQQYLIENPQLGYDVQGFIDRRLPGRYSEPADAAEKQTFLGTVADLGRIARTHFIDEVLVTLPSDRNLVKDVALKARRAGMTLRVVPDLYDGLGFGAPIEFVGQFPTMALHQEGIPAAQLMFKRAFDVVGSTLALVALTPLFAVVAVLIKLDSKGPVFYHSTRVGKKGQTFTCHKFRTMELDAEQRKKDLAHLNEREGVLFKISNDPRITRLGRFLRKFSVDELPQLWNVLCGEMSLVGPRPPVPEEYTQYAIEHRRRLQVVPGITGLWQVEARQSPSFDDYINLDLQYVENWSIWLDLKLMLRTVLVVFAGTGR